MCVCVCTCVAPPLCRCHLGLCVYMLTCMFVSAFAHTGMFFSVTTGFNHFVERGHGQKSAVTLPRLFSVCVCVCVCVCMCVSLCIVPPCCSPAPLLMTQQSTLMTSNTHSLLLREPQLINWSVKHRKYCSCRQKHNRNQ